MANWKNAQYNSIPVFKLTIPSGVMEYYFLLTICADPLNGIQWVPRVGIIVTIAMQSFS